MTAEAALRRKARVSEIEPCGACLLTHMVAAGQVDLSQIGEPELGSSGQHGMSSANVEDASEIVLAFA
jgi:hypothetical protein